MSQSKRKQVTEAVKTLCEQAIAATALPEWSLVPKVEVKPPRTPFEVPPEGLIILRDRGLKSAIAEFGQGAAKTTKELNQTFDVEIYIADQPEIEADDALDALTQKIGDLIEADPTFGGLCDDGEISEGDEEQFGDLGSETQAGALLQVTCMWFSERTLG